MKLLYGNFVETTLAEDITESDLSITLENVDNLPTPSSGEYFRLTLMDGTNAPEIVEVSELSGTTATVTRAKEGTAAQAWTAGTAVRLSVTKEAMEALFAKTEVAWGGVAGGTANAITIETEEGLQEYREGQLFAFQSGDANTDEVTIAIDGLDTISLLRPDGSSPLAAGMIPADSFCIILVTGTKAVLLLPVSTQANLVADSLTVSGNSTLANLIVSGMSQVPTAGDDDSSTKIANTGWVAARLTELALEQVADFTSDVSVTNGNAFKSALADDTATDLIQMTSGDVLQIGDAETVGISIYAGGTAKITIGEDGIISSVSPSPGDDSTKVATTEFVVDEVASQIADVVADLSAVPVGAILDYAGTSAPSGWLMCYGQAISRTTYADLFTAISTTYGTGDGSTTFNVPDIRGRVSAGKDDMGGTSANRLTDQTGGVNGDILGDTGGAETHTLTTAQLATHTHTAVVTDPGHSHPIYYEGYESGNPAVTSPRNLDGTETKTTNTPVLASSGPATTGITVANSNAGSGSAHNNVQPTIIFNKIIKT